MTTIIHVVEWWTLLSCTLGPLATWMFFYPLRRQRAAHRKAPKEEPFEADLIAPPLCSDQA